METPEPINPFHPDSPAHEYWKRGYVAHEKWQKEQAKAYSKEEVESFLIRSNTDMMVASLEDIKFDINDWIAENL